MANQRHLERFLEGSEVWNEWRRANPDILPDLSGVKLIGEGEIRYPPHPLPLRKLRNFYLQGVNLERADLSYTDLYQVDLKHTNLRGADLSHASLVGSRLVSANLRGANLSHANLCGDPWSFSTNLRGANLIEADLSYAILCASIMNDFGRYDGADLKQANLKRANLSHAVLCCARLQQANLEGANLSRANLSYTNLRRAVLRRAYMEQVVAYHTDFQQADLREVPRLLVMHMMREPGVEFAGIIWDGIEAKGEEEDGIS